MRWGWRLLAARSSPRKGKHDDAESVFGERCLAVISQSGKKILDCFLDTRLS
jgi:hypothetical protein